MKLETITHSGMPAMPAMSPDTKADKYVVASEIIYKIIYLPRKLKYTIRKGFVFDGASIPRMLWSTTGQPYRPDFIRGALLHDFLYRFDPDKLGKQVCDEIFYEILKIDGVGFYTAWKMLMGVKFGGGRAWKGYRKK